MSYQEIKDFIKFLFKRNKTQTREVFLIKKIMKKIIYCERQIINFQKEKEQFENMKMLHIEVILMKNSDLLQELINIEKLKICVYKIILQEIYYIYKKSLQEWGYDEDIVKCECKIEIDPTCN